MLESGVLPILAMSYVSKLRQLFARWVRPYYEDHNWKMPQFPSLGKRPIPPRYERPAKEKLEKVKNWYTNISSSV